MTGSPSPRVIIGAVVLCALVLGVAERIQMLNAQSTPRRVDLLWQDLTAGGLQRWEMAGAVRARSASLSPDVMADPNWKIVGSGDFNADGLVDIVWHHQTTGQVAVWHMNGPTRLEGIVIVGVSDTNWKVRAVGDLNNDNHPDLIWERQTDGLLAAWFLEGIGWATGHSAGELLTPSQAADPAWQIVGTGDLNGNSKTDLIWQHQTTGQLAAWYMDGEKQEVLPGGAPSGVLLNPDVVAGDTQPGWRVRAVVDLNTDDHPDLVWQHPTGTLAAWLMTGINQSSTTYLTPSEAPGAGWMLMAAATTAQASTPTLSLATGTYGTNQSVSVSTTDANAVMRYTTTGAMPTESDALVPVNGTLTIDQSVSPRVRAWVTGLAPSLVASADYVLQAAPPVFSPLGDSYTSAQTVTISTTTAGATIRYTTDGTLPSPTSLIYTTPLFLTNSVTLKAAAFKEGWSTSAPAAAAYAFHFGILGAPVISPNAGTYLHGQQISISGPPGATLRYTMDGTIPTESSAVYTGPLTLSSSMSVSARAFEADWTASATACASFTAQVASPTVSLESGTYTTEQTPIVSISLPGATIHYTTNGQDPSENDAVVPSGGQIAVDRTLSLHLRAWAAGHTPSDVIVSTFILQPPAPAIAPSTGVYASEQAVSIQTATPGTTIRFTIDGSEPSELSPIYSTPFVVTEATTVRARSFKTNWTPSEHAEAVLTFSQGALNTPVATPDSGAYDSTQSVSLTSGQSAAIRYTLDDSNPTEESTLYQQPLVLREGPTTIKARAFKAGWTDSPVLIANYEVQLPLSIHADVWPKANALGWHNTNVVVSFRCTGAVTCPEPVTVTSEGLGLLVSGSATSSTGSEVTDSVSLNIDRTPPTVSDMVPTTDIVLNDTWTATVSAALADVGSGLESVKCNGLTTALTSHVSCELIVRPGSNSALITAVDLAGNSSSMGRRIFATGSIASLDVSPATRTMLIGEIGKLDVVDQSGRPVPDVTWTTSDSNIVTVAGGFLNALSPGQAEVTVERELLSGTASITVLPGASRPYGTLRWSKAPEAGAFFGNIFQADPVGEDPSDFLSATFDQLTGSPLAVYGLSADGRTTRVDVPPIAALATFGPDRLGGVLSWGSKGVSRFGGGDDARPWHYDASDGLVTSVAQGSDATIFLTEFRNAASVSIVIVDGQSGTVRARIPLAPGHTSVESNCIEVDPQEYDTPAEVSSISVDGDGIARVVVARRFRSSFSPFPCSPQRDSYSSTTTVELLSVQPNGTHVAQSLQTSNDGDQTLTSVVTPVGMKGSIVNWSDSTTEQWRSISAAGVISATVPPAGGGIPIWDKSTDSVHWIATAAKVYERLVDNGAIVGDGPTLQVVDNAGAIRYSVTNIPLSDTGAWNYWPIGGYTAPVGGTLTMIDGPEVMTSVNTSQTLNSVARPTVKTDDLAAIAAIHQWLPPSNIIGREFGGSICRVDKNKYFASEPEKFAGTCSEVPPTPCDAGTRVGGYHAHVCTAPGDGPSGGDALRAHQQKFKGYLGVAVDLSDRPIDCASKGQGNIWKYVMDTSVPYNAFNPVFTFREVIACTPVQ